MAVGFFVKGRGGARACERRAHDAAGRLGARGRVRCNQLFLLILTMIHEALPAAQSGPAPRRSDEVMTGRREHRVVSDTTSHSAHSRPGADVRTGVRSRPGTKTPARAGRIVMTVAGSSRDRGCEGEFAEVAAQHVACFDGDRASRGRGPATLRPCGQPSAGSPLQQRACHPGANRIAGEVGVGPAFRAGRAQAPWDSAPRAPGTSLAPSRRRRLRRRRPSPPIWRRNTTCLWRHVEIDELSRVRALGDARWSRGAAVMRGPPAMDRSTSARVGRTPSSAQV
ncbi:hypothetical protein SAMN02745121_05852 [Nannocystis exedens]|uniref:Uncharacterized protein n=1 Tax=Nannocystis exedens TaxID=54 RepID=A0A1I2E197_9BACT|nr:hypothetical protein NAEX_02229 [Nannocystis exedens]SFE86436.1 hypothetical protein SAMN02745121_05852 [Nannocystis exedens]